MGKYTEIARAELDKLLLNNNDIAQEIENAKAALGSGDEFDFTKAKTDALQQIRAFYQLSRGETNNEKLEKIVKNISNVVIKEIVNVYTPDNDDIDVQNLTADDIAKLHALLNTACSSIYGVATFNTLSNKNKCIDAIKDMMVADYKAIYVQIKEAEDAQRKKEMPDDENAGDLSFVDYAQEFKFSFATEDQCIATRYIRAIAEIAREAGVYNYAVKAVEEIFMDPKNEDTPRHLIYGYRAYAEGKSREEKLEYIRENIFPGLYKYAKEGEKKKDTTSKDLEKYDTASYKTGVLLNFIYDLINKNEVDTDWLVPQFASIAFNNIDVIDNTLFFLLQLIKFDNVNPIIVANDIYFIGMQSPDPMGKDHAIQVMGLCLEEANGMVVDMIDKNGHALPGNEQRLSDVQSLIKYIKDHKNMMEASKLSRDDAAKKAELAWQLKIDKLKTPLEKLIDEWNKLKDDGKLDRTGIQGLMDKIPSLKRIDSNIPGKFLELLGRADDYKLDADMMNAFIGPYLMRCLADGFVAPNYEGCEYKVVDLFISLQEKVKASVPLSIVFGYLDNLYRSAKETNIAAAYNLLGRYFSDDDFKKLISRDTITDYYNCILSYLKYAGKDANVKCVWDLLEASVIRLKDCDADTLKEHVNVLAYIISGLADEGRAKSIKMHEKTPDNVMQLNVTLIELFGFEDGKLDERALGLLCGSLCKLNMRCLQDDADVLESLRSIIAVKLNEMEKDSGDSGSSSDSDSEDSDEDENESSASWKSEKLINIINKCLPDDQKLIQGIDNSEKHPPLVRSTILELSGHSSFFMQHAIEILRKNKMLNKNTGVTLDMEKKVQVANCKIGNNIHRIEHYYGNNRGIGNIEQILKNDNNENRPELVYVIVSAGLYRDDDIVEVIKDSCERLCKEIRPSQIIAVVYSEAEEDEDSFKAEKGIMDGIFKDIMDEGTVTVLPLNGSGASTKPTQDTMKAIFDKVGELFPQR